MGIGFTISCVVCSLHVLLRALTIRHGGRHVGHHDAPYLDSTATVLPFICIMSSAVRTDFRAPRGPQGCDQFGTTKAKIQGTTSRRCSTQIIEGRGFFLTKVVVSTPTNWSALVNPIQCNQPMSWFSPHYTHQLQVQLQASIC